MTATTTEPQSVQTVEIHKEEVVNAPIDVTFQAVLDGDLNA